MIYDIYENKNLYSEMGYEKAFDFIKRVEEENLPAGRYEIDGDIVYGVVSEYDTKTEIVYEAHKKYIDVQYVVSGHENICWKNLKDCKATTEYNPEKDCGLYEATQPVVLNMPKGSFAVLFPEDAHAPGIAHNGEVSEVKKIVVKIKID